MAYILSKKKSTYGSPYAFYSCAVTQKSRTPTAVTLTVTAYGYLQYSTSYLGTGSGYGLVAGIKIGGTWYTWTLKSESTKWSGTTSHSASRSVTVSAAASTSALSASFRVLRTNTSYTNASLSSTTCSNISITNVSNTYSSVAIAGNVVSQAEVKATLSGLPSAVGYTRVICWYKDGTLIGTTTISSSSTTTSYTYTFTGLMPSTSYNITAEVRYNSTTGTLLSTKAVTLTTSSETGSLTLDPKATYLTVDVADMFETPNYTRSIEVYYKKTEGTSFVLAKTISTQGAATTTNITGLASNESYDVKVLIKSGTTVLLTLAESAVTLTDTSLVPTGIIESITQKLGTRECTLDWLADKSVAGTTYEIQAKATGEDEWTVLATLSEVETPYMVVAHNGNIDMAFRIVSWNYDVVDETVNYSDEYSFYVRDDFVWDSEKAAGSPLIITAVEWNRLGEYVVSRNADIGISVELTTVRAGDPISADIYNTMKNAINNVTESGIEDKRRGDAISAADIDALRVAINTVAA